MANSSRHTRLAAGPVALGYADSAIGRAQDVDPFTSKLGGRPVWLDSVSVLPARATVVCGQCQSDMPLLVQAYVPLHDSPYDRVLYVWACNRRACSGRPGAASVVRAHLLNPEYAQTLAKRAEEATKAQSRCAKKAAPLPRTQFSGRASPTEPLDFGSVWSAAGVAADSAQPASLAGNGGLFSGLIFGAEPPAAVGLDVGTGDAGGRGDDLLAGIEYLDIASKPAEPASGAAAVAATVAAAAAATADADWARDIQGVPAMYLSFEDEVVSAEDAGLQTRYRTEIRKAVELASGALGRSNAGRAQSKRQAAAAADDSTDGWDGEQYERTALPRGTDATFARFLRVVGQNPEQALRYQFGGAPLLYTAQDETARLLGSSGGRPPAGGGASHLDDASDSDGNSDSDGDSAGGWMRRYSTDRLPRCPHCGGRRVFECQLMPALLRVLPLDSRGADLRAATAQGLAGKHLLQSLDLGLEFGTVLVFVCENDCDGGLGVGATYYGELALVQLEAH
ncbi:hypothetical protein LPJ61_000230 [Coemansia biformis]|uniref:Programmed cell death protein 2 C-terminal domain-containing protein n=1 Tax=Coemansia biformis TaxID=1286918 RepID=A0A9W7YI97_9FUNG|nr:hypothetical protein LPJ61_000230 [Coemansia biformis]